jgi:hypothetical protein
LDNDADPAGLIDIQDRDCISNAVQDWSDLFFEADMPQGTRITFDVCTASDPADLEGCVYATVGTVSSSGLCATDAECRDVDVGGTIQTGYCSAAGQCQFIEPPKLGAPCMDDDDCQNGPEQGRQITSHCDMAVGRCRFTSQPVDIHNNLAEGDNGQPYAKVRVTLHANADASQSPTLYNWELQYYCHSSL